MSKRLPERNFVTRQNLVVLLRILRLGLLRESPRSISVKLLLELMTLDSFLRLSLSFFLSYLLSLSLLTISLYHLHVPLTIQIFSTMSIYVSPSLSLTHMDTPTHLITPSHCFLPSLSLSFYSNHTFRLSFFLSIRLYMMYAQMYAS